MPAVGGRFIRREVRAWIRSACRLWRTRKARTPRQKILERGRVPGWIAAFFPVKSTAVHQMRYRWRWFVSFCVNTFSRFVWFPFAFPPTITNSKTSRHPFFSFIPYISDWSDYKKDAEFVSPFKKEGEVKYLTFEHDCESIMGFSRMPLAFIFGRLTPPLSFLTLYDLFTSLVQMHFQWGGSITWEWKWKRWWLWRMQWDEPWCCFRRNKFIYRLRYSSIF